MIREIEKYVHEREIDYLVHFTRVGNLGNILRRGLVPRDTLALEEFTGFNDQVRLDRTDAVCLSIGFPNYKLFYPFRQTHLGVEWVVLVISRNVLWELPCAFCTANAASSGVSAIPLEQRMSLAAFHAMYGDFGDKARDGLGIPKHYPTNPQAEVLMLDGVGRKYILGLFVSSAKLKSELNAQFPAVDVRLDSKYFDARRDYPHWK